jgi:hypothetical protein
LRIGEPLAAEALFFLGYDLVSEKKKRERAPAGEAQIFTRFIVAKGLR